MATHLDILGATRIPTLPPFAAEMKILSTDIAEAEKALACVGSISNGSMASLGFLLTLTPQDVPKVRLDNFQQRTHSSLTVGSQGNAPGQLYHPRGIAIDARRDILLVAEYSNNRVSLFDLQGKFIKTFGNAGAGPGELSGPVGIAIDPSTNHILVAEYSNCRVQVFSEEGEYVSHFRTISQPQSLALDESGRIFVVTYGNKVQVFERGGTKELYTWGKHGGEEGDFYNPYGIAVNGKGEVIVCNRDYSCLNVFSYDGTFLRSIGKGIAQYPWGVCVDAAGNILVTQNSATAIVIFDSEGKKINGLNKSSGMGEFNGICVDKAGRVVVADYSQHRILFF
jgi:DNA-binding beta-propeller fold protein YncE